MIFNDFSILTRELSEDEIAELDELAELNKKSNNIALSLLAIKYLIETVTN